eukprot:CAMPEP_0198203060 /NCGR_PEP_ID=MMETSP1445-20131203/6309_1 /TAXON_ID=36898 /ORGANISM="Pyramimonas sp., Strain CCMP2087" /LENGTH=322 /DNA_ID=CAMNT_0043874285 /DNA_START=114 /DNA_END=1082 /DNA_ORIENTATION=-
MHMGPARARGVYALILACSFVTASEGSSELDWFHAQPIGCLKGEQGESRWCQIHDDGSVTLRTPNILRDKLKTGLKKLEQGKAGEGKTDLEIEITAAKAVLLASEEADTKYDKAETQRQKGLKSVGTDRRRLPARYRCRKNTKRKELELLEYHCTVTDYKLESTPGKEGSAQQTGSTNSGGAQEVSDLDRCTELLTWQTKFSRDQSEGKTEFWRFLATAHEGFEDLQKLKTHSLTYGTGTGKMLEAIEMKASKTYKKISKELHPDKQVKLFRNAPDCNAKKESLIEMLKQLFDRAANLKKCILKPLRCDIPEEVKIRINDEL